MSIKYQRGYLPHEKRILRTKGFSSNWHLYNCRRVVDEKNTKHLGQIVGRRGEWYRVAYKDGGYKKTSGPFKSRDEAAQSKKPSTSSRTPTRKFFSVRRGYGDDLYSWAVYDKRTGRTILDGESRHQAGWYADKFEREAQEKEPKQCGCRSPKSHRDCMYCGNGWAGEVVCGVCKEQGIDGKVIRGTERRVCKAHKQSEKVA